MAKLAILPPDEQDRVGRWLLDELRDEDHWARQFAASQDILSKLAAEARADLAAGRTTPLDPEKLTPCASPSRTAPSDCSRTTTSPGSGSEATPTTTVF